MSNACKGTMASPKKILRKDNIEWRPDQIKLKSLLEKGANKIKAILRIYEFIAHLQMYACEFLN